MTELKTEYEGALQTRIEAATAAKDSAFKLQQRAEAAEAALDAERIENKNLRGPLASVSPGYATATCWGAIPLPENLSKNTAITCSTKFRVISYLHI